MIKTILRMDFNKNIFKGVLPKLIPLFFFYKVAKEKLFSSYPRRARIPRTRERRAEFP